MSTEHPRDYAAPSNSFRRSVAAVALLLLAASPLVSQHLTEAEERRDALRGITVRDSRVLTPDAANEVELDDVRLELLSDGSTRVRIAGELRPGETKNFAYIVDRERATYTAFELPASYIHTLVERARKEGDSESTTKSPTGAPMGTPTATPIAAPMAGAGDIPVEGERLWLPPANIGPPSGTGYCDYQARGVISHYDPVLIELATTTSTLRWRHDHSSNCLDRLWANRTCWAAAVTPLGTHWFINVCSTLDRNISLQHLQKSTHGHYSNYDFGDPSELTWADHYIQIDARTGISTFVMADNDGGEYSALIFSVGSIGLTDLGCSY